MKNFIFRYQIPIFCAFNIAVTYILSVVFNTGYIPQWMPGFSAVVLILLLYRKKGLITLSRKLVIKKQWMKWYVLAGLFPVFVFAISYIVIYLTNNTAGKEDSEVLVWKDYMGVIIYILVGSIGEEIGWRGYLYSQLLHKKSFLTSCAITGLVWGVWHVMFDSGFLVFCVYILLCIETSVCMGWVFYQTRESVVPAIIYHASTNVCAFLFFLSSVANNQIFLLLLGIQVVVLLFPCIHIIRFYRYRLV